MAGEGRIGGEEAGNIAVSTSDVCDMVYGQAVRVVILGVADEVHDNFSPGYFPGMPVKGTGAAFLFEFNNIHRILFFGRPSLFIRFTYLPIISNSSLTF